MPKRPPPVPADLTTDAERSAYRRGRADAEADHERRQRAIRAAGGRALAASMTPEQRRERAAKAGRVRQANARKRLKSLEK